jgi:hypothetical protein
MGSRKAACSNWTRSLVAKLPPISSAIISRAAEAADAGYRFHSYRDTVLIRQARRLSALSQFPNMP